ncbi:MAG: polysaccharide biosynthesis tyrosine autokinase [Caulobacteraceae bacterium]|nr:polysaccharide biosynthesis tyrosine autokinase [Caulobacteraceae bacterium]
MSSESGDVGASPAPGLRLLPSREGRSLRDYEPASLAESRLFETGAEPEQGDRELNFLDLLGIAFKWRWLLVAAAAAGVAAGAGATFLTARVYEATATIQIDHEAAKIVPVQSEAAPESADGEDFYQTQYALLRSRALAGRVVKDEKLADDGAFLNGSAGPLPPPKTEAERKAREDRAVAIVTGNLRVDPVRGSRLVHVSYDSPSPEMAARIANAAANGFIAANLEHRYEASSYARQFLEQRLNETREKLEDSERQLVAYAAQNQIINLNVEEQSPGGQAAAPTSLAASDLASVNGALASAVTARIQAEQRWRQAQSASDLMTLPEVQADSAIQAAVAARAQAQAEYRQNRSAMKPDHPTMLALQAKIEEQTREIAARAEAVRQSLKNQYEVALRQEQSLGSEVNRDKGQVLDLRNRSIRYNILQREVDTNKSLYDGLLQRYKEIGVAGGIGANNISVVDAADPPIFAIRPSLSHNIAYFSAAALGLGVLLAFLLEKLDVSIKTPDDVERKLNLPLLGAIPKVARGSQLAGAIADQRSLLSEAYYSVRTALNLSTEDGVPSILLVTSARSSEGKTTTAIVLARSFARLSRRVLLVDGDMRAPALHKHLGLENDVGLSNLLSGHMTPSSALQATEQPGLSFLACGPRPPNPTELLGGDKFRRFLDWARNAGYLVIIDGPPVLGLADAPLLAGAAEGTLVVIESGGTKRELARMAVQRLKMVRARVVGAVLAKFDLKKAGYGYGLGYAYGYTGKALGKRGFFGRGSKQLARN